MLVVLVWLHFLGDFLLQSDWMAQGKSTSNRTLAAHVAVYTLCFLWAGPWFCLVNFALHFVTDFVSSRVTARLWKEEKRHWFFVVIGLDQALHLTALILTYEAFK